MFDYQLGGLAAAKIIHIETVSQSHNFRLAWPIVQRVEGDGIHRLGAVRGAQCEFQVTFSDDATLHDHELTVENRLEIGGGNLTRFGCPSLKTKIWIARVGLNMLRNTVATRARAPAAARSAA